jgi:lipopolysaccharide biosynthesis protein
MKAIAFYLPQFHPIPENDEWWGRGFTEWTNVTRAKPLFTGHDQPRLPADLGFYDLRLAEVRNEQASLAKRYGLHGFYWFNGKKLLDLPLRKVLESGEPDFPFCLCYANENWTRRWDGLEDHILIQQEHSPENDRHFIQDIIPVLKDKRYIKIGNKPLLLVYRSKLFPDPLKTTGVWREEAKKAGIEDLYLCKCQTFEDFEDPKESGFDAVVEFPPHGLKRIARKFDYEALIKSSVPSFEGYVFDYNDISYQMMAREWPEYTLFKTVMLAWDNTARTTVNSRIFINFTVELYERWLSKICRSTIERYPEDERLVFINSWNEWAEGTYLEPDQKYGHDYLRATDRAITSAQNMKKFLHLSERSDLKPELRKVIMEFMQSKDETEVFLMNVLEEKEARIAELESQLHRKWWLLYYYKLRDKLLPMGTKRRLMAKDFRDRVLNGRRG